MSKGVRAELQRSWSTKWLLFSAVSFATHLIAFLGAKIVVFCRSFSAKPGGRKLGEYRESAILCQPGFGVAIFGAGWENNRPSNRFDWGDGKQISWLAVLGWEGVRIIVSWWNFHRASSTWLCKEEAISGISLQFFSIEEKRALKQWSDACLNQRCDVIPS